MRTDMSPVAPLRGSACPACGVATYPASSSCPRCGQDLEQQEMSQRGTLWTWTVQRYPPKSPPYLPRSGAYEPFVVGYVELPDGVRVEALVDVPIEEVAIGMDLDVFSTGGVPHARVVAA